MIYSNLILAQDANLNAVKFGWSVENTALMLNVLLQYQRCTLSPVASTKNALEDVSGASVALHVQKLGNATEKNFVRKLTNILS